MDDDDILEELDLPDGVREADDALEILRAWIADGALHVTFDPETFRGNVGEWGRLLSDIAQHVSHAVELDGQMARQEAMEQIHKAFKAGMSTEAVTMQGRIKGRTEH